MYTSIVSFLMNCIDAVRRVLCIFSPSEFLLPRNISECIFHLVTFALSESVASILLSNLGVRFCLRGVGCDAPGFQSGLLTLMIRSTELTLVKRWSTWAITLKTSPTTPNDTPWSTHGQGWVKTLVKPLKRPLTLLCRPELLPRSPNFT
jgi:hypothetical protein